jgi:hypothetical protein
MSNDDTAFRAEVLRVMQSGRPSDGDDLLGMEIDFVARLSDLNAVDDSTVSVRRTSHADSLIVADCAIAAGTSLEEAADEVRQAWVGPLRYNFYEAHDLTLSAETAVLRFVTQIGPGEFYVTGEVTVRSNDA